jgi:hypothetical protein
MTREQMMLARGLVGLVEQRVFRATIQSGA